MSQPEHPARAFDEPTDYFTGIGNVALPTPTHILLFSRALKSKLQQNALQNRSHHRFVLILNMATQGQVHVDHLSLTFRPGQAILIHPYQFHHFTRLESPSLDWLFCTFELQPETWLEPLRNFVFPICNDTRQVSESLVNEWLRCSEMGGRDELQNEHVQNALLRLLLSLKQDGRGSSEDLPSEPANDLLRTIHRLLSERKRSPVRIVDLAKEMALSESYLRARFKQTAGIPLGSYLQHYRLNRAIALLQTTTLPISDVAEEAGFGSPQAFSHLFKKETGLTPRAYRYKS